jgi:glycosyltransferase involved in cell wall biosynthesis
MADQVSSYTHFARAALRIAARERHDLVFATSGRLMTAALASWISRRTGTPLFLDIRDIFVDSIVHVVPRTLAIGMLPFLNALERWTIGQAAHVNLVSRGFAPYFESRYPAQSFSYFTNGIDDEFIRGDDSGATPQRDPDREIRVLYAGNMGEGQGLHTIVPELARRLRGRATFRLIGDGGRRARLVSALANAGETNVELMDPMSRDQLIAEYLAADVLFLHLNDYDAFEKVLPSKVFEYAALGKPIWAGVAGYPAQFIRSEVSNAAVFPPCDVEKAVRAFDSLDLRCAPRETFIRKYSRKEIMRALAADMLRVLETGRASGESSSRA